VESVALVEPVALVDLFQILFAYKQTNRKGNNLCWCDKRYIDEVARLMHDVRDWWEKISKKAIIQW
jgi:hypothetical protein